MTKAAKEGRVAVRYHSLMASTQLIPPPDMAPPSIARLSPADRVRLWAEMVDEGDRLLFAAFMRRYGDEAAARRAAQHCLDRRAGDSLAAKVRLLERSRSAESRRGQ